MKKVAVSACLLGELCRYDGASKPALHVREALEGWEIIPFCPEAPVLGTPRERISVLKTASGSLRVKGDESGRDVTDLLRYETLRFLKEHPDVTRFVLKSKSPSCGLGTTPVLDMARNPVGLGNGLAAQICLDRGFEVQSELDIPISRTEAP